MGLPLTLIPKEVAMQRAMFQEPLEEKAVRCHLCAHRCTIAPGRRGVCRVRENRNGTLYSLVYGRLVSGNADPIEKKPIFHLLPGSLSYSIATAGCNFRCRHCQNFSISQYPRLHGGEIPGDTASPAEVVAAAKATGCASISYTYIEPTIFIEFALETAQLAKQHGLKNVFVSNGYTSPEASRALAPVLDANNIDLKSFNDRFYREICGARLQPVLDTIALQKKLGVWIEVTTLLIPGLNDSDDELREIASFLANISPEIPWHVTRFHPTFELTDRPPTPAATLRRAREIGLAQGLQYVYTGNLPGEQGENTYCPACQTCVVERSGFFRVQTRLREGHCTACGALLAGIWQ